MAADKEAMFEDLFELKQNARDQMHKIAIIMDRMTSECFTNNGVDLKTRGKLIQLEANLKNVIKELEAI